MARLIRRNKPTVCSASAAGLACPLARAASVLPGPERLVGYGFRFWMQGRRSGDLAAWESAWSLYCGMFGPARARIAVDALSDWVVAVDRESSREIEIADGRCPDFCRDECLAISMIAACQHNTCPALRACAFALVEDRHAEAGRLDAITAPARSFADTMASLDQVLSASSIVTAQQNVASFNTLPF